jgi:hypothetical protein
MLKTVEGTFKSGVIRLDEPVRDITEGRVLVTFLEPLRTNPVAPSLTPSQAAELRGKLAAWEEDWNAPGMEAYDEP